MSSLPLPFDAARIPRVDAVGIEERAASLGKRSIKKAAKVAGIKLAISMLDLTTLEGKDSEGKVRQLCQKAMRPQPGDPSVPHVAAVCVYPNLVAIAKDALARQRRQGRVGRERLPGRASCPSPRSSTTRGSRSRPAPTRSTW